MSKHLSIQEIEKLDPYQLMGELGKKVIHPGGRQSTRELLQLASLRKESHVLEIGCGVGTTAISYVSSCDCSAVIVDLDENMVAKARVNVEAASLQSRIQVEKADIQQLPFADASFDAILIEAVTMFVNRQKAVSEVVRVCKPGGTIVEQEFIWRQKPTPEARRIFEGEVCPGIKFDTAQDWIHLYRAAGVRNTGVVTGPFRMMSFAGFLSDEGLFNSLTIFARALSRIAYLKKITWLMPRIIKVRHELGYIVFAGVKDPWAAANA